jgi:protein ImuB
MERTLCVWFPDWPLRPGRCRQAEPAQAVDDGNLVVAVNAAAAGAGIRVGMRRREAEAICPTVSTVRSDPAREAVRFEPVMAALEELVPRVEMTMPGLVFVPVGGAIGYYGSEGALLERVVKEVDLVAGDGGRFGLAGGPFAARIAAAMTTPEEPVHHVHDDEVFRRSLDVGSLGRDELAATFRWLGIRTLGDLAGLPREAVASRFGHEGLAMHRLAMGEDREVRPRVIPGDLAAEERFVPPLEVLDQAGFAARALANRLMESLAPSGARPHRVEIEAESASGVVRQRTWRSNDPFDGTALAERVRWQLRAWVESGGIPGGIVRLRIVPADLSDEGRQLALHEDAAAEAEARRAFIRAQALVGPEAVLLARAQGGRDPGEQVQWYRLAGEAPRSRPHPRATGAAAVRGGVGRWAPFPGAATQPVGAGAVLDRSVAASGPLVAGGGAGRPIPDRHLGGSVPLRGAGRSHVPRRGVRLRAWLTPLGRSRSWR